MHLIKMPKFTPIIADEPFVDINHQFGYQKSWLH